ncbi:hypothetical protein [Actinokineospora spheciospongiae]|uniref:hypothetical protein n=1 Tax=Actinokineospora spheciospongiae TaxID=909613 RepID=UPI003985CA24
MAALDFNSGVSCGTMLGALGWEGDTRLTVREVDGLVVFTADPGGEHNLVGLRRVRLPSSSRRRLAVRRGDQLLLIADSSSATLTLYSPAVVADVVAAAHRAVGGRDRGTAGGHADVCDVGGGRAGAGSQKDTDRAHARLRGPGAQLKSASCAKSASAQAASVDWPKPFTCSRTMNHSRVKGELVHEARVGYPAGVSRPA